MIAIAEISHLNYHWVMFAAFFESIKFIGHLLPVSFLRIYLGYMYLNKTFLLIKSQWIEDLSAANRISQVLQNSTNSPAYLHLFENFIIPYWQQVAFIYLGCYLCISISYLLGYLVRPMAYLATLLAAMEMGLSPHPELQKLLLAIHIFLGWIGAGRVLGIDYYFYKRYRGLFW